MCTIPSLSYTLRNMVLAVLSDLRAVARVSPAQNCDLTTMIRGSQPSHFGSHLVAGCKAGCLMPREGVGAWGGGGHTL